MDAFEAGFTVAFGGCVALLAYEISNKLLRNRRDKQEFPIFRALGESQENWQEGMASDESLRRSIAHKHNPSDVVILTVPKTGTTWLMQICHIMRGGQMDFDDIYQVVPWSQISWDLDIPLNDQKGLEPKLFKTHNPLRCYAKRNVKIIATIRQPERVVKSFWSFIKGKGFDFAQVPLNEFWQTRKNYINRISTAGNRMWEDYIEFWRARDLDNVLVLCFEDLTKDFERQLKIIADFLEISPTPELIQKVADMSSKDYMGHYQEKFDESWALKRLIEVGRVPDDKLDHSKPSPHITKGDHGSFTSESLELFKEQWATRVEDRIGLKDYAAMQDDIRATLQRKYAKFYKS